jgi:hypothetical protein
VEGAGIDVLDWPAGVEPVARPGALRSETVLGIVVYDDV